MKQLAIMKDVHFGMRDTDSPIMWFSAYITEHQAALQILDWKEAGETIAAAQIKDIEDFNGMACWVDVEGSMIRFLSVAKI